MTHAEVRETATTSLGTSTRAGCASALALSVAVALGCQGDLGSEGAMDGGADAMGGADAGPRDDGGGGDADPAPDAGRPDGDADAGADAGTEPEVDAGTCAEGSSFAEALTVMPVDGTSSSIEVFAAPTSAGGAVIACGGSPVHLTHVDGLGRRVGSDVTVEGNRAWGVAVADEAGEPTWAVLVDRSTDVLSLVGVSPSGTVRFDNKLLGDVSHDVTGNEWFGRDIRTGRLDWTGSRWVAYHSVQRLWDDGVRHYGDQLRYFERDGSADRFGWDWGCSHSMEVRLSHNDDRVGPVCLSDCYPNKGVHFNHRTFLYPDEEGSDCRGGYGTGLGASVAMSGGFWVAFTAIDDRPDEDAALVHVGNDRSVGDTVWLTEGGGADTHLHAARYGASELVVGWVNGGRNRMVRVDASSGTPLGTPRTVGEAGLERASDFFRFADGDVGWVLGSRSGVSVARLRVCR